MKKALKTATRGTVFPYAGEKWVVLEHDPAGRTLCLRLEVIPDKPFDEGNRNNFAISSSKEWMNGPYLDNLIDAVKGPHAFLTTELDLTADDGLKDYGTCTVSAPGLVIWITPPQAHISLLLLLSAGLFPTSTRGDPGVQGAGVTGTQGMGVSTPSAAAVAAATWGLASEEHMPKGMMFFMGT